MSLNSLRALQWCPHRRLSLAISIRAAAAHHITNKNITTLQVHAKWRKTWEGRRRRRQCSARGAEEDLRSSSTRKVWRVMPRPPKPSLNSSRIWLARLATKRPRRDLKIKFLLSNAASGIERQSRMFRISLSSATSKFRSSCRFSAKSFQRNWWNVLVCASVKRHPRWRSTKPSSRLPRSNEQGQNQHA